MGEFSFDVVIVGGGPAGLSCGIFLAKKGIKTLLIERGRFCGSKNLFGGVIYTSAIKEIVPEFPQVDPKPYERPVTEEGYLFLAEDGVLKILHSKRSPEEAFTALRARFDSWLSDYAQKQGLLIVPKTKVIDFIRENSKIGGVVVDRPRDFKDERKALVYAKVVVLAEGVNRILTEKVGLIKEPFKPEEVVLSVKEVLQLPKGELERRFSLDERKGCAYELIGEITSGFPGSGFIYTNENTISFGLGVFLNLLAEKALKPYELLERAKRHPFLQDLFRGAEILEYGAHLIPEWGLKRFPKLYGNGILVVGDAAGLVNPLFREGTNLAIYSGLMAGETILEAFEKGDFTEKTLKAYEERFKSSYIYKDFLLIKDLKAFLLKNPQIFNLYPQLVYEIINLYFSAQGRYKKEVFNEIKNLIKKRRGYLGVFKDFIKFLRFLW